MSRSVKFQAISLPRLYGPLNTTACFIGLKTDHTRVERKQKIIQVNSEHTR